MSDQDTHTQPNNPSEGDTTRCSHITSTLADAAAKDAILRKYKAAIAWNVYYLHSLKQLTIPARLNVSASASDLVLLF